MSVEDLDIFVLQILVSKLNLSNPPSLKGNRDKTISPTINFKIEDGPNILIPFLSRENMDYHLDAVRKGHNHPPIEVEEAILKGGVFNFDKGKSCLFTTHILNKRSIKFQVEIQDGLTFPSVIVGSSDVLEGVFDPKFSVSQTLFKGKLKIMEENEREKEYGILSIFVTLQSIGSSTDTSTFIQDKSSRVNSMKRNQFSKTKKRENTSSELENLPVSSRNKRISSYKKGNHKTKLVFQRNGLYLAEINSDTKPKNESKAVLNNKPTGWLRSTPLYKGNIYRPPITPQNTRSSFFRLYKMYPDIQDHVNNEIEKQLKERVKKLDNIFQESKKVQPKLIRYRSHSRSSITQKPIELKVHKGLQTEINALKHQETLIGNSLIENVSLLSTPTFEDHDQSSDEKIKFSPSYSQSVEEAIENSIKEESSTKVPKENIGNLNKRHAKKNNIHFGKAVQPLDFSRKSSESEIYLSVSENLSLNKASDVSVTKSDQILSLKDQNDFLTLNTNFKDSDIQNAKEELKETPKPAENNDFLQDQEVKVSAPNLDLFRQSSKTSSSVYPQSSEEKVNMKKLSTVPQSPSGDNLERTISDISERITNILKPKTTTLSIQNTDSISSYVPSNLSEEYSSLSDIE